MYSLVGRKNDYMARRPSAIQTSPEGVEEYVDRRLLGFLLQYGTYALELAPALDSGLSPRGRDLAAGDAAASRLRERLAWCDVRAG